MAMNVHEEVLPILTQSPELIAIPHRNKKVKSQLWFLRRDTEH